jgi:glycosyltransferase involved in cell wall biosynthesis
LASASISVAADVADLRPFYDAARLFIAPTRFAAGIPLKVIHAAAHGLPIVSTPLLARQLRWAAGADLMAAETAESFASCCAAVYPDREQWLRLRTNGLSRVARQYSPASFGAALMAAVSPIARP